MILDLRVKNFVLIEDLQLSLDSGFIVFTGETGAGKSLLIKAIKLLLGEKASLDYIKPGEKEAQIEALIWGGESIATMLEALGRDPEEEIHIKRIISPKRQRTFINGSPATLKELSNLTKELILLTSQHEFYTLLSPESQLKFLDEFAGLDNELKEFLQKFNRYKELKSEVQRLAQEQKDITLKREFLEYQLRELEELSPSEEEEEELLTKRERLKNLSVLKEDTFSLCSILEEVETGLHSAISVFDKLQRIENFFSSFSDTLRSFYYELKEIIREVETYKSSLPEDDQELDQVEERLAKYEKLKKKYQTDTKGLKSLLEEIKDKLSSLETHAFKLEGLKEELASLEKELITLAKNLSEKRKNAAKKLEEHLKRELADLGLEKSKVLVEVISEEDPSRLTQWGFDRVRFLFIPNPGAEPRPLEKIASGGELSRIFLAFKSLLKRESSEVTLIFDEVDTGIGGITAKKLGKKLKALSENAQVICITHLPQIAALADVHYVVEKHTDKEKTSTTIRLVEGEERLKEIARMLGHPEDLELAKKFLSSLDTNG